MPFVKFEQSARGGPRNAVARVCISAKGQLRMNRLAIEELGLADASHVTLHWDADQELIGLLPCAETEAFAGKLGKSNKDGGRVMGIKTFLCHFEIESAACGIERKPMKQITELGDMIIIPLDPHYGEVQQGSGAKRRGRPPKNHDLGNGHATHASHAEQDLSDDFDSMRDDDL